jgi:type I restriction enzyme R subunit
MCLVCDWALLPTQFSADVLGWIQVAQPEARETLVKSHGEQAGEPLLARMRGQFGQQGMLGVLRHGIELLGLRQPLKLAEFEPSGAVCAWPR